MEYGIDNILEFLHGIVSNPVLIDWCIQYSYDDDRYGIRKGVNEMQRFCMDSGILISNYRLAIELFNWDDLKTIEECIDFSYLKVLSAITWHFRRDYFCNGSIIRYSIPDGSLYRLFMRLKSITRKSVYPTTLETLFRNNCECIPTASGIYRIIIPDGLSTSFFNNPKMDSKYNYNNVLLSEKYLANNSNLLYIGKASGKSGLRQRIRQYMNVGFGTAKNHMGGRAIWQMENAALFLLEYEVCYNCSQREHELLAKFHSCHGNYPLANWRR